MACSIHLIPFDDPRALELIRTFSEECHTIPSLCATSARELYRLSVSELQTVVSNSQFHSPAVNISPSNFAQLRRILSLPPCIELLDPPDDILNLNLFSRDREHAVAKSQLSVDSPVAGHIHQCPFSQIVESRMMEHRAAET